jgi:hypothetical protein
MRWFFMVCFCVFYLMLFRSCTAHGGEKSTEYSVVTTREWRNEQRELPRLRKQLVSIGAGTMITGIGTGNTAAYPVIGGNLAFLSGDYYIGHGGSAYIGGRVSVASHAEVTPFAVGATVWHDNPLWANGIDRQFDASFKIGLTIRLIRFVELGVFAESSIPISTSVSVDDIDSYDNVINIKDEFIDALMPRITIRISTVCDVKRKKK